MTLLVGSLPVERIVWRDASDIGAGTWITRDQDPDTTITSVGIVTGEDDLYVSITHSFNHHENEARGIFAIPKTAILSRDRLHSVP